MFNNVFETFCSLVACVITATKGIIFSFMAIVYLFFGHLINNNNKLFVHLVESNRTKHSDTYCLSDYILEAIV